MNRRLFTLVVLAASLLLAPGAPAVQLASPPPTGPKIGDPAPGFEAVDTAGGKHRLEAYRGRIVILEWINPECPFVERHYRTDSMPEAYKRVKKIAPDAVWLAIDSTSTATREKATFWIQQHKLEYPIILDSNGALGHRYDARRTPEMFVIDGRGALRYRGAIDDNDLGTKRSEDVTNYVVEAVRRITADEPVTLEHVKPYGCSVKFGR